MAYISVTYTFSNGETSDATKINQNFTDIINGLSTGLYDIAVNNITINGELNITGDTRLGNYMSDKIYFLGSLASDLVPDVTNYRRIGSYDYGFEYIYTNKICTNEINSRSTSILFSPASGCNVSIAKTGIGQINLPIGAIFMFTPAYGVQEGTDSGSVGVLCSITTTGYTNYLDDFGLYLCNGVATNIAGSPICSGVGRAVPNISPPAPGTLNRQWVFKAI